MAIQNILETIGPTGLGIGLLSLFGMALKVWAWRKRAQDLREHAARLAAATSEQQRQIVASNPPPDLPDQIFRVLVVVLLSGLGLACSEPAYRLVAARGNGFPDPRTVWRRAGLAPKTLQRLAEADAFASMGLTRREALWAVRILGPAPLPLFAAAREDEQANDPPAALPAMTLGEEIVEDYTAVHLSLRAHPLELLRGALEPRRVTPNAALSAVADGKRVTVAGLVIVRQRPGTAKGVIFMTLEDEAAICNVIVWPHVFERLRPIVMGARLILVKGVLQREGIVTHVVADDLEDISPLLDTLSARDDPHARPMPLETAHADEVARPNGRDPRDPAGKAKPHLLYPSRDFH